MPLDRSVTGRAKGTPNKMTVQVKEAIIRAFDEVGGHAYLVAVAREEPRAFCALLSKLVPRNDHAQPSAVLELTDSDLNDRLAALLRDSGVSREAISTGDSVDAEVVSVLRRSTE